VLQAVDTSALEVRFVVRFGSPAVHCHNEPLQTGDWIGQEAPAEGGGRGISCSLARASWQGILRFSAQCGALQLAHILLLEPDLALKVCLKNNISIRNCSVAMEGPWSAPPRRNRADSTCGRRVCLPTQSVHQDRKIGHDIEKRISLYNGPAGGLVIRPSNR